MFIGKREVQAQFINMKYDTSYKLLIVQNIVHFIVIEESVLVRRCNSTCAICSPLAHFFYVFLIMQALNFPTLLLF